jgi:hypothetical protein
VTATVVIASQIRASLLLMNEVKHGYAGPECLSKLLM